MTHCWDIGGCVSVRERAVGQGDPLLGHLGVRERACARVRVRAYARARVCVNALKFTIPTTPTTTTTTYCP